MRFHQPLLPRDDGDDGRPLPGPNRAVEEDSRDLPPFSRACTLTIANTQPKYSGERYDRAGVISYVDPVLAPLNKSLLVGHHSLGTERRAADSLMNSRHFIGSPRRRRGGPESRWVRSAPPTERIAHLCKAGDCCDAVRTAWAQSGKLALGAAE